MNRRSAAPTKTRSRLSIDRGLQERAAAFLAWEIPAELKPHHVPGSLAEVVLRVAANGAPLDADLREIAAMSLGEYDAQIAGARTDELRKYFSECRALLDEILSAPVST